MSRPPAVESQITGTASNSVFDFQFSAKNRDFDEAKPGGTDMRTRFGLSLALAVGLAVAMVLAVGLALA